MTQEYPWPPGKAPWALERGGTGIPPDGARENWGKNKQYGKGSEEDSKPVVVGRVFAENKNRGGGLPSVDSLKAPKNEEDAIKMIQLGEKMLSMGLEFSGSRLNQNERSVLGTCLTAIVSKILVKRGMRPNGHHSPPRERQQLERNGAQKKLLPANGHHSPQPGSSGVQERLLPVNGHHSPQQGSSGVQKRSLPVNGHHTPQQGSSGGQKRSRDRNSRSPSPHPLKSER